MSNQRIEIIRYATEKPNVYYEVYKDVGVGYFCVLVSRTEISVAMGNSETKALENAVRFNGIKLKED